MAGIIYKSDIIPGIEVLSCTDDFEFRPHIHDRFVVWFNTGGGEHFTARGSSNILAPGDIAMFEPGLVHANRPCSSRRHLRSFYIDPGFFTDLLEQADIKPGGKGSRQTAPGRVPGFERNPVKDRTLWRIMARIHDRLMGNAPDLALETGVTEAFSTYLRRHGIKGLRQDIRCDRRVGMMIDFFHANLDRDIRLADLAEAAGCTQFHLIRLFRTHLGMPPHAYLLQLRLEHARRLISKGIRISDAALDSGFADQSHLTRAFKRRYGLTPSAFLRSGAGS